MFKKTLTAFLSVLFTQLLMAHDLPIKISSKIDVKDREILARILEEVGEMLPAKVKSGLPRDIELRFEKLSPHNNIPNDVCSAVSADKKKNVVPFVYGKYNSFNNSLVLNTALLYELAKGREISEKIKCQHKSLYDQAIATIIHELAHAYDTKNGNISNSNEFIFKAGFKKGLLRPKNKNVNAMRSADPYELSNVAEAYAVNMEYFAMDPEFACRKPSMFEYFKRTLGSDAFPDRNCQQSNMVMMSTSAGHYPMELDHKRVYRIDYLLAAPGRDMSSGFGHSMFRIIICAPKRIDAITNRVIPATPFGSKCLEDRLFHMVVSYRANIEDATLNPLKGILGGYPSMLFILNFADVIDEYNRDELRDIVSYPLKLNTKEKQDFITKVLEEHWNYRGSYKFITNNCAVESFDLLKSVLDRSNFHVGRSITPNGVLKDLDQLEFLSLKDGIEETFRARTEQLIKSYKEAYSETSDDVSSDANKNKKAVLEFISKSSSSARLKKFNAFSKTRIQNMDLHTELSLMKKALIKAASFSVLEQQILRSKTAEFRKKVVEVLTNSDNQKIKEIIGDRDISFKEEFSELAISGYGIPLTHEMISRKGIEEKSERPKKETASLEAVLKELIPNEIAILESINANIEVFTNESIGIRKAYREKLNHYMRQVIINLSYDESSRTLLLGSLSSSEDLNKVRQLLDINLVSEKEILDIRLRKLIEEILNQ